MNRIHHFASMSSMSLENGIFLWAPMQRINVSWFLMTFPMVYIRSVFAMVSSFNRPFEIPVSFSDDVLIYLNNTNLLKPPIAMTLDRFKSEFTALRRQGQSIQVGICRCTDRSVPNNTTIKHLGALTRVEFENLSHENRKPSSTVHTESKKLLHLFSNKKKSVSHSNRDSGFVETDGKKIPVAWLLTSIDSSSSGSKCHLHLAQTSK